MKKIIIALLALAAMTACQKDIVTYHSGGGEKATGAPTVTKITPVADPNDILSEVAMGQMIAIYGNNFAGLKELKFNDLTVDLNNAYVTNNRIVTPVPRTLPDVVNNKLTIVGAKGTLSYDVTVVIPMLKIDGLYNEFSAAGAPAKVSGDFFDIYELIEGAEITVDGTPVELTSATATALNFVIPVGTPDGAVIELSGGRMDSPVQMKWREQGYLTMKYGETINGSDDGFWAGSGYVTDGSNPGDPAPLPDVAKFLRVTGTLPAWNWTSVYGGGFSGSADPDWAVNPQDYMVKFEMLTKSNAAITVGNFKLMNAQVNWNPAEGMAFNTYGEWRTVSFEMTHVMPDFGSGWNNFVIIYQPAAEITVDFSVANGRIVHK